MCISVLAEVRNAITRILTAVGSAIVAGASRRYQKRRQRIWAGDHAEFVIDSISTERGLCSRFFCVIFIIFVGGTIYHLNI